MTDEEYRKLIEQPNIKASDIANSIEIPQKVWRYRRLAFLKDSKWVETSHWKDDVTGICYFSIPDSFNKNDDNDCMVRFDKKVITEYMLRGYNREKRRSIKGNVGKFLERYQASLQGTMRIGCFTDADPTGILASDMWADPNFGSDGRGICIEYDVREEDFRPDSLPFLKVLYDDKPYDNTEAMKAIIDYAQNSKDTGATEKMLSLGYGHTLIKPKDYKNESEWRIVIPIRDDKAHLDYFNVDNQSKRDMSNAITAIYLGYNMDKLPEYEQYINEILATSNRLSIPIYQVKKKGEQLIKERFVL